MVAKRNRPRPKNPGTKEKQGVKEMVVWAIVPVKPLRRGKSRLSKVLDSKQREELNKELLEHTLSVLTNIDSIEQVLVISRDQAALSIARDYGARTVLENGSPQLNDALTRATAFAENYSPNAVLIVPADLPLLNPTDINTLIEMGTDPPVVVIAPDEDRKGTNSLMVSPSGMIKYKFGENSFEKHCQSALESGARLEVCELSSFALDVDLPEDLDKMKLYKESSIHI